MADGYHHGVRVMEINEGCRIISTVTSARISIVAARSNRLRLLPPSLQNH